ncbi:hypothetical protein QBC38DRAFT_472532 [Podospora fimiseda]|uniref:Rhodopsin domain-containing protein n=1 Tax=Podospora fimiseda TaxID=252190 RepID=A0AAN7BTR2_9PEZI|nr:hypothetical protein QBC38DRAFT_472532 [Podospora fimiseda]
MAGGDGPPQIPTLDQLPPELLLIDNGDKLIRTITPVTVLATIFVFLRLGMRLRRVGLGLDDYLIIFALIFTWGTWVVGTLFVKLGGLGRPMIVNLAIDPNRLIINQKLLFSGELIYPTVIALVKFSILAMYQRVFPTKTMKLGHIVLGGMTAAWYIAVVLVAIFQCKPVKKVFNPMLPGTCIDPTDFFLGNSIPNIVTDVAILALPTYEVYKLNLPRHQRIGLGAVFLLGAGIVAVSSYRLYIHILLAEQGTSADFTMALYDPVIWTVIEPDMAVICASLPSLGPMLTTFLNSRLLTPVRSYFSKGSGSYGSGAGFDGNVTIGGTPMKIPGSARGGKKGASSNLTPSNVSSQERLNVGDPEAGFVPDGYVAERRVTVGKASSGHDGANIPLESIAVKTVVDWRETKGPSSH